MDLTVLTPAPSTAVISLAAVKSRLGITDSNSDSDLTDNIEEVASALQELFGRELARQTYQEMFPYEISPGRLQQELRLACNPIEPASVTLSVNGSVLQDWYVKDAEAGIVALDPFFPNLFQANVFSLAPGSWRIQATYTGGFVYGAAPWAAAGAVGIGAWVRAVATPSALRFVCTTPGTTGATEPHWPSSGLTVIDGTAVWTAHVAWEFPATIRQLAFFAIRDSYMSQGRPSDLVRSEGEGFLEIYSKQGAAGTLSVEVRQALEPLRLRYGR